MALCRLAFKKNVFSAAPTLKGLRLVPKWSEELVKSFGSTSASASPDHTSTELSVSAQPKLFPRRNPTFVPILYNELFPAGLGSALVQATENINKVLHNINMMGRMKEQDECYKVRYEVPGLAKDDVKITVDDGVMRIKGEHKEEDDKWSDTYFSATVMLPHDAVADGIKADLKDGLLSILIPRNQKMDKDVKEIIIH